MDFLTTGESDTLVAFTLAFIKNGSTGAMGKENKITMLNVDDDPLTRRLIHRFFVKAGYTVFDAQDGVEALKLARLHRPSLAIVDIHLPNGINGLTLCRMLRESQSMDVFITTGILIENSDRLKAYQVGAIRYFKKPVSLKELLSDVNFSQTGPEPLVANMHAESKKGSVISIKPFPKILVANDDEKFLAAIGIHMEETPYTLYAVRSGHRAVIAAHKLKPALIVMDINLPDVGGAEVIRLLKAHPATRDIPVLVLTDLKKQGKKFVFLDDSAQDYLLKGVHEISSLPIRIAKILCADGGGTDTLIQKGPVAIDLSTRNVFVFGQPTANLTPREFQLLSYLMERSPAVVSWDDIEREIWGIAPQFLTHSYAIESIEVHLRRLRLKLGQAACCMVTHKGVGIQFTPIQSPEHALS